MPIAFGRSVADVFPADKSFGGLLHHETWWAGEVADRADGSRANYRQFFMLTSMQKPPADGG